MSEPVQMTKTQARMESASRLEAADAFILITTDEAGQMNETHSCSLVHLLAAQGLIQKSIDGLVFPKGKP